VCHEKLARLLDRYVYVASLLKLTVGKGACRIALVEQNSHG